ncbi:MAG TPA: DddA-like double-stranded DNA deaminase toxin [Pseudonocardiaceae bacterium]|jgi:hypothetical protein|nr:DddA-like double-stranded DNA deaminase toxin [Pseudonocardiaceae bacterium]
MPGHVDDAADAFAEAAGEVPVEAVIGADQQLAAVGQSLQAAGGGWGERLMPLVLAMREEGRRLAAELATLRQQLHDAAASRRSSAPVAPPPTGPTSAAPTSASAPEPTVQARDGSRYPAAAEWCVDLLPRRVRERQPGEKTCGYVDGRLTPFISGRDGGWTPKIEDRFAKLQIVTREFADVVKSHVEMKVATMMIEEQRQHSELVINHSTCGSQPGRSPGCDQVLEPYLPKGYTLTVHGTTQQGEPFSKTYRGRA